MLVNAVILLFVHTGVIMVNELYRTPFARKLSIAFVNDENSPDDFKTMAMAYWAIFVGHDLSHTAMSPMSTIKT